METSSPPRLAIAATVLRVLVSTTLLVLLYAILPLRGSVEASAVVYLVVVMVGVATMFAVQVRSILRSSRPALRAVEALSTLLALLLLAFASGYVMLSESDPAAFSEPLSKVNALYFTITVLATVGFGDITPVNDAARIVVSIQMLFNLLVLGLGIRIGVSAVRLNREGNATPVDAPDLHDAERTGDQVR